MSQYRVKGLWICSSTTLNAVWDWTDMPLAQTERPHPLLWQLSSEKNPNKCQAKIPAEQMSRWPSGCMWFCLLYVEVLFCCMRRSAVSLGCSEPGWERWREGTTPTHRLYPEWGIGTFSQNVVCILKSYSFLFYPAVPRYPSEKKNSNTILINLHFFYQPVLMHQYSCTLMMQAMLSTGSSTFV